ncbi:MAG: LysM peptidoglycan-binding domain-containing protein, partial [Candidatus Nanoarchaeia archaeon]
KIYIYSIVLVGFLCGCESMQPQKKEISQKPLYENMVKVQEAEIAQLKARVNMLQDALSEQTKQISTLNQNIQILDQKNQNLANEVVSLRQALNTEKRERQAALDGIVNQIGKELNKAIAAVPPPPPPKETVDSKGGPPGPGTFIKYEVQAGATLNAIAQAYGVTVEEIKKANKLKSDTLKAGQIIYIPKK